MKVSGSQHSYFLRRAGGEEENKAGVTISQDHSILSVHFHRSPEITMNKFDLIDAIGDQTKTKKK